MLDFVFSRAKFVGQLYNLPYAGKGRGSRGYEREGYRIKREDEQHGKTYYMTKYNQGANNCNGIRRHVLTKMSVTV